MPIAPATERAAGYNGVHYQGTLFVNTDANHGIVQIAGHELLHQLRRDQPELYDWFADNASRYFKPGALRSYGRRLQKAGANLEQTDVREELLVDVTGDALADPAFLPQLAADNSHSKSGSCCALSLAGMTYHWSPYDEMGGIYEMFSMLGRK